MNGALMYRANNRKLIWVAFGCAITIHLSAIAIATTKTKPLILTPWEEPYGPVIGFDTLPPQVEEVSLSEEVPPPPNEDAFPEEISTPPTTYARKKTPISPIRSTSIGTGTTTSFGSVKSSTLYAPKPNYPYQARRSGVTGSGVVQLTVNSATGNVVGVRMTQTTGSPILDIATLETLQRWRFKTGVVESIKVPITFTLRGASY